MPSEISSLHDFITGEFRDKILALYKGFHILTESDLQAHAWLLIRQYLSGIGSPGKSFRVINNPYVRGMHPDIVVFKGKSPDAWVVIELKELRQMRVRVAEREMKRLKEIRKNSFPKRAYLIYVARFGKEKLTSDTKKGWGMQYYFFEVPITLEGKRSLWARSHILQWEKEREEWNAFKRQA